MSVEKIELVQAYYSARVHTHTHTHAQAYAHILKVNTASGGGCQCWSASASDLHFSLPLSLSLTLFSSLHPAASSLPVLFSFGLQHTRPFVSEILTLG